MQTAPFSELLAVPAALSKNPVFDIIIDEKITLQNYCNALIEKTFTLRQSDLPAFIDYQSGQVKNTIVWLNKFEKLLANNQDTFILRKVLCRFTKLMNLVEHKREKVQSSAVKALKIKTPKRLINATSDDRYFSYYEVKNHIETLPNFSEKLIYLTQEAFAYKQADKFSINTTLQAYDEQCNHQIEHLQTLRKMRADYEKEQRENLENVLSEKATTFKIRINGPINILTDVYKQMMNSPKSNGKTYISHSIKDITKFICANYLDELGNELSPNTIRTYLSPTRNDKDPNNDTKIWI
jgi:glutamyl/glutaminyl-tRNA synthetase